MAAPAPTLGLAVGNWIEAHCKIPDGTRMGEPYLLTGEMWTFLAGFYAIDRTTGRFVYERGAQLVRPQKAGKGPFSAAIICAEAGAPVVFDHWEGDEPIGRPWATPHIQVTAVSEDQTDNVFRALLPMIQLSPLLDMEIADTGLTRINLPGGGLIEPVTASARSRLGQRITFAVQDETHSWLARNGGRNLADNQRRNLAGMGGRFLETTNAWDPTEDSVAQLTAGEASVLHDDREPPARWSVRNKRERWKALEYVYGDACTGNRDVVGRPPVEPWVDLYRIDTEIVALLAHDAAQAERFFLNRKQAGESAAFDGERYDRLGEAHEVPAGSVITIGVDGARFIDALAVVATDVVSGYQWTIGIWERPKDAKDDYEHPMLEVDGAVSEAFATWSVWRLYADPQKIEGLLDKWQGRWGSKRVVPWFTNRPRQMCWAVRNFTRAIGAGDVSHDGNPALTAHIKNAKKRREAVLDDQKRQMHTICKDGANSPRSIDGAIASVLSWECRGDAIAAGAEKPRGKAVLFV